jgi:hypothetical protein
MAGYLRLRVELSREEIKSFLVAHHKILLAV